MKFMKVTEFFVSLQSYAHAVLQISRHSRFRLRLSKIMKLIIMKLIIMKRNRRCVFVELAATQPQNQVEVLLSFMAVGSGGTLVRYFLCLGRWRFPVRRKRTSVGNLIYANVKQTNIYCIYNFGG